MNMKQCVEYTSILFSSMAVFSVEKSLRVLKKFSHQDLGSCCSHVPVFLIHTLSSSAGKIKKLL